MAKINACVFISGKGTNLKRLILNSKNPEIIKSMEESEWIGKNITFNNGSLVN